MADNLVIVESPAKAKTIKKYLGKDFEVLASYGHVRDLVAKEGAVDTKNGFAMKYDIIRERNKDKYVDAIEKAARKARALYLATDPDREGEAISWHLHEILKERGVLDGKPVHRAKFFEITRAEVQKAIENPESLSHDLVDAQQARRALDYLVGFNLSPLLWKKIMPGLSAGRVQSVALRLICDREVEIGAFVSQEYWTVEVEAQHAAQSFRARLAEFEGAKVEADVGKSRFTITSEQQARVIERRLAELCAGRLAVADVEKKPRSRSPLPPFRTSTLQQTAANRLGYTARRTMQLAQKLYEGVDFGEGPAGLITYMRTDSVALGAEAIGQIREFVGSRFADGLPDKPRVYTNKQANAQEAHEGIRPTSVFNTPEKLKGHIDDDMWRLYTLIWQRTVASQMNNALYEQLVVSMHPGGDAEQAARASGRGTVLRATGSTLLKPGFLAVYGVSTDDDPDEGVEGGRLPPLGVGDKPALQAVLPEQHFTQPPPRYTEASLVKALEERGIGRPSTYASIIETLRARKYVEDEKRNFVPTDTGKIVYNFLVKFFAHYVDYDFTARLEEELDEISRGEKQWVPVMEEFWAPFIELVNSVEANVSREEVAMARELGTDPVSGKPVTVRMGRFGPFVQIGTRDDEEKPRFAGLRPGQKMDSIRLPEALELFKLPRTLGQTASGEPVTTNVGRFGPYVKYGSKYVSLRADDDPYEVTLERALELIRAKQEADANRIIQAFESEGIQVLNGRFGPYITDGKKNAKIPKDRDPRSLTLEDCRALIAAAPERGTGRFGRFGRRKPADAAAAPAAPAGKAGARKSRAAKPGKAAAGAAASSPAGGSTAAGRDSAAAGPAPKRAAARTAGAPRKAAGATPRKAAAKTGAKAASTKRAPPTRQ